MISFITRSERIVNVDLEGTYTVPSEAISKKE